ncbi:DUF1801 domain-containing protein [Stenotrophomonas sp. SY1]|uniref:iron chaperone n=1 Tax=Stenotrophomonas sp. SY1 TaxID=477235 RepID=UPI001E566968|nr:DUF1801 domain-containing protein [Stenotrophomonas sp. SY1]MCD9086352.1 DUF1801 domain-containing protein [Stenotrophomonas sp. SY1]
MAKSDGFTAEERAAMKERARELKAEAKAGKLKAEGEADIMDKIGQMPAAEGKMAKRLHEIITTTAPALSPKTWYGMPAYANTDGKVVVFFQGASKFGSRYSTLGFNDSAALDDGDMWPTVFAVVNLTAAVEKKIAALVKKAVH